MLIFDLYEIGGRLFAVRKKTGLTQEEVAELADLSGRTYADIERGKVDMRIRTFLRICAALHITPDEILTKETEDEEVRQEEVLARLDACPPKDRETALRILSVYLRSLPG